MLENDRTYKYAIYSDETESFRIPWQPSAKDWVKIRIRVYRGSVSEINLVIYKGKKIPMEYEFSKGVFDYYFAMLEPAEETIKYYFELKKDDKKVYYAKTGVFLKSTSENSLFSVIRDFYVPDWFIGTVMYQIFTDRFNRGNFNNDVRDNEYVYLGSPVKYIEDWNENPKPVDIWNFYGGDIQGILDKLDYLSDLGVEVIYLNPVFVSPSNHKYDVQDYDYIDPHFGAIVEDGGKTLKFERFNNNYATKYIKRTTSKKNLEASNKLFSQFVYVAHERGIKIIIYGVFNHCGASNKWLDKDRFYEQSGKYPLGAYKHPESIYSDYFYFYDDKNEVYDGWWGYANHPKLNFEKSEKLYNYFMVLGRKWVTKPLDVDGWRLDVAADLGTSEEFNHKFWKDFRRSVKSTKKDAVILAEHYGDPSNWLKGGEWDTVMNYDAFMEPLTRFLTGMEKHSNDYSDYLYCNGKAFKWTMLEKMSVLPVQSLYCAMNQLSNHDHSRFLTRTNRRVGRLGSEGAEAASEGINKGIMREAVTFQMTWIGSPTVYYGDEAGLAGWTDPDNRRTYPWGREDHGLIEFHKQLIRIRKENPVLRRGGMIILNAGQGIFAYGRLDFDTQIIVVLNNREEEAEIIVPVWETGAELDSVFEKLISSGEDGFDTKRDIFWASDGDITVTLPARGSIVLRKTWI